MISIGRSARWTFKNFNRQQQRPTSALRTSSGGHAAGAEIYSSLTKKESGLRPHVPPQTSSGASWRLGSRRFGGWLGLGISRKSLQTWFLAPSGFRGSRVSSTPTSWFHSPVAISSIGAFWACRRERSNSLTQSSMQSLPYPWQAWRVCSSWTRWQMTIRRSSRGPQSTLMTSTRISMPRSRVSNLAFSWQWSKALIHRSRLLARVMTLYAKRLQCKTFKRADPYLQSFCLKKKPPPKLV